MDHHDTPPFCILRKGWMSVLLCSLTAPCAMNKRTQWAIKYALKLRRGAAYRIPLAHPQWKLRHANPCYFRKVGEKGHLHFGIFCCNFAQANVKVSLPEAFFCPQRRVYGLGDRKNRRPNRKFCRPNRVSRSAGCAYGGPQVRPCHLPAVKLS